MRHAFRVAASLDSMVMGEPQILGQVKEAYEAAEKAGSLGSVLNALRNRSVAAAKRARTETAHRQERGLRLPRGGRAGAQDLRRAAGPVGAPGRRGEDERAGRPPAGPRRGPGLGPRRPDVREGRAARGRPRGQGRAPRGAARRAGARRHRDQRHRGPRDRDPAGGRGGGAGRAPGPAALPHRHRGAARRRGGRGQGVGRLPLRPRRPQDGRGGQPPRAEEGGLGRRGHRRAGDPRVPRVAPLARRGAAPRRAAQARRRDPQDGDREGAPAARPAHPGAGERPRGRDHGDRQQAPPRPHRAAQGDGRERPARSTWASSGSCSACEPDPHRHARQRARPVAGGARRRRGSPPSATRSSCASSPPPATGCSTGGSSRWGARAPSSRRSRRRCWRRRWTSPCTRSRTCRPCCRTASRCARSSSAPTRATRSSRPGRASRSCRRGPRWAPRACAARRWCARCARTSCSPTCAGTWTRASRGCGRGASTRSCSRWPASPGSAGRGRSTEALDPRQFVPAPGQGAIALECRDGDAAVRDAVAPLDHAPTARAVAAERAFLAALGGGCNVPLGAHAFAADGALELVAFVAAVDGDGPAARGAPRLGPAGPRPRAGRGPALAGRRRAPRALRWARSPAGASSSRGAGASPRGSRSLLEERGAAVLEVPAIEVVAPPDPRLSTRRSRSWSATSGWC